MSNLNRMAGNIRKRLRALIALAVTLALAAPAASASADDGGSTPLDVPVSVQPGGDSGGGGIPGQTKPKTPKRKKPARKRPAKKKTAKKKTAKKPTPKKPVARPDPVKAGYFPVLGSNWTYGGADMKFGAARSGHTHQGQDIAGDEGTMLVSPTAGTITYVGFQDYGAGYYLVLRSTDGRDLVFMHCQKGSIRVKVGEAVAANRWLARLGNTGHSTGPHLHFEIWVGGWYTGGHPIDPLPQLKAWEKLIRRRG